jgi:15-cis-phytoene synthase
MTDRVRAAYDACEAITRREAKNFSYGIRLLPPVKRRALSAVYAVARRIDDIGDGPLPPEDKMTALADTRKAVRDPGAVPGDPVMIALTDAAERLPIPLDALEELLDGCEADVLGTRYADWAGLERYCRCVAGSVGRLSLGVFSPSAGPDAARLADTLGIALQVTNILRDIREDLLGGRVYLPAADLERFGVRLRLVDGRLDPQDGRLAELVRFEAGRGRVLYAEGLELLPLLDRRSAACCAAMAGIYRRLLDRIEAEPDRVLAGRTSLPTAAKAAVAARALVRGAA